MVVSRGASVYVVLKAFAYKVFSSSSSSIMSSSSSSVLSIHVQFTDLLVVYLLLFFSIASLYFSLY